MIFLILTIDRSLRDQRSAETEQIAGRAELVPVLGSVACVDLDRVPGMGRGLSVTCGREAGVAGAWLRSIRDEDLSGHQSATRVISLV